MAAGFEGTADVAPESLSAALHVTNGDATDLPGTGLAPEVVYWRDALHEGPVPALESEQLRRVRAEFLAGAGADDRREGDAIFLERDRALERNRHGRYVLWFEADLYDQLQIIQILARLSEIEVPAERITLVCIGEYPGIARFGGLGELSADQLRELPSTTACTRLTPVALDFATRAWAAFRAPTPEHLGEISAARCGELRFVGEAFDRLAREYPSTRDGLSLTQRRVLAAVAAGAPDAGAAFVEAASRESRPYLGDTWCFGLMTDLAQARTPLLETLPVGRRVDRTSRVRLTQAGVQVLAGREDHVRLNGIDRWIGGVHLAGSDAAWRWDEGRETIIASAPPSEVLHELAASMDFRLEMITVPVADVDRAKAFYAGRLDFRIEQDLRIDDDHRFVELVPPGSRCTIALTLGYVDARPGSLRGAQLNVADADAAQAFLSARGVEVSEVRTFGWGRFCFFSDPDGNEWSVHEAP
jgi:predicted enzyme related to lactoylglutathione lyase